MPICSDLPILSLNRAPSIEHDCAQESAARKIYGETAAATAQISDLTHTGSGFFINDGTKVVTNAHVVASTEQALDVISGDGKHYTARIEKLDDINDLAILSLERNARHGNVLALNSKPPATGDALYALGHPDGLPSLFISPGKSESTASLRVYDEPEKYQGASPLWHATENNKNQLVASDAKAYLDAPRMLHKMQIRSGNSGGPVVDKDGLVVSVIANGYASPALRNYSIAVPVEKVNQLLESKNRFNFEYKKQGLAVNNPISYAASHAALVIVALASPRLGALMAGELTIMNLLSDYGSKPVEGTRDANDTNYERMHWITNAVILGGSILAAHSLTRRIGLVGLVLGQVSSYAQGFIPQTSYLHSVKRTDGELRPPLYWS